jgi:Secretion system C-terminal sorting domain
MITGVTAPATSPDLVAGIFVVGAAGSDTRLYYNSVSMTGDRGAVATQMPSYGIAITGTDPTIDLRDNILYTTQIASGGGVNAKSYAIGMVSTTFVNLNSNYNDFWSSGANDGGFRTGSLTTAAGTDYATLAGWAAAVSDDANSLELLPVFNSDLNDLHLTTANCGLDGRGVPIAGITDDYDCNVRNTGAPDMGADEFTATLGTTLAVTVPGTTDNTTYNVSPTGTVFSNSTCGIIDGVLPNGGSPASGLITSKVTIDATVQTYGGTAYVQRHFDITPAVNQSGATARVTLYALQSEFDAYNLANGAEPDLMTAPGDASGKANLRVTKYSGNGTAPGNYVPGVATLIDPADADIVWDAVNSWWTITFNVTGFSGFYIHSGFGVLPVSILNFSGYKDGSRNQLRWTTSSEQNNSGFEMQRSTDGVNYSALGFVNTLALGGNSATQLNYAYTDNNVTGSRQYYRLRQLNFDGNSKLSNIVLIKGDKPVSLTIDGLFPNPASTLVNVLIATPSKDKVTLVVTDIAGRNVIQQLVNVETGSNTIPVDISRLSNGTYMVKLVCSSNCESAVGKFVKQ